MATSLPPASDFTSASTTKGDFKTAMTDMRSFQAGLLGTDGTVATALATLGTLGSGYLSKSATYTLTTSDRGKVLDVTGTWTLGLPAVATAGAGFSFDIANSGTGTITIDPSGAEQIDGATTLALGAGRHATIICTGTAWVAVRDLVQASVTDATPGAQMINGAWGTGNTGHLVNIGDWDATDLPGGLYLFSASTANLGSKPAEYVTGNFGCVRIDRYSADYFTQTCWRVAGDALPFMRRWQNGSWTAWQRVFVGTNIVGTVSQSGGVPTEAIIERGSNANGSYTRWADGTQICWGTIAPDFTSSANQSFIFPAAFSATPRGRVGGVSSGSATAIANEQTLLSSGPSSTTSFRATLDGTGTNGSGAEYQLGFNFTGRWF